MIVKVKVFIPSSSSSFFGFMVDYFPFASPWRLKYYLGKHVLNCSYQVNYYNLKAANVFLMLFMVKRKYNVFYCAI